MATYADAMANALLDLHSTRVASGSAVLKDGATTIATISLDATPFAAAASRSMDIADTPLSATAAADTTDNATELTLEFENSSAELQFTLTVSTSADGSGEAQVSVAGHATNTSKPALVTGQNFQITSGSLSYA